MQISEEEQKIQALIAGLTDWQALVTELSSELPPKDLSEMTKEQHQSFRDLYFKARTVLQLWRCGKLSKLAPNQTIGAELDSAFDQKLLSCIENQELITDENQKLTPEMLTFLRHFMSKEGDTFFTQWILHLQNTAELNDNNEDADDNGNPAAVKPQEFIDIEARVINRIIREYSDRTIETDFGNIILNRFIQTILNDYKNNGLTNNAFKLLDELTQLVDERWQKEGGLPGYVLMSLNTFCETELNLLLAESCFDYDVANNKGLANFLRSWRYPKQEQCLQQNVNKWLDEQAKELLRSTLEQDQDQSLQSKLQSLLTEVITEIVQQCHRQEVSASLSSRIYPLFRKECYCVVEEGDKNWRNAAIYNKLKHLAIISIRNDWQLHQQLSSESKEKSEHKKLEAENQPENHLIEEKSQPQENQAIEAKPQEEKGPFNQICQHWLRKNDLPALIEEVTRLRDLTIPSLQNSIKLQLLSDPEAQIRCLDTTQFSYKHEASLRGQKVTEIPIVKSQVYLPDFNVDQYPFLKNFSDRFRQERELRLQLSGDPSARGLHPQIGGPEEDPMITAHGGLRC
jgi:hypothetical protein